MKDVPLRTCSAFHCHLSEDRWLLFRGRGPALVGHIRSHSHLHGSADHVQLQGPISAIGVADLGNQSSPSLKNQHSSAVAAKVLAVSPISYSVSVHRAGGVLEVHQRPLCWSLIRSSLAVPPGKVSSNCRSPQRTDRLRRATTTARERPTSDRPTTAGRPFGPVHRRSHEVMDPSRTSHPRARREGREGLKRRAALPRSH